MEWLEKLIEHEARFFEFAGTLEKRPFAWFLYDAQLSDYRDANHAMRLRDDGRGPESVAHEVIAYYRARNRRVAADIDEIAEAQGIGRALRRLGITPVIGNMLLMRYPGAQAPAVPERGVEVRVVAAGDEAGRQTWADVVMSQEDTDDPEERAMWEEVTRREARYPLCRHYLGYLDGQAAGACELFMAEGWGRIESVVTRAAFRRRGVATAVVAQAVADSLAFGHSETYLYTEQGGAGEQVYLRLGFETRAVSPLRRHLS